MTAPSQLQIIHAYRSLYRAALRAVQYSSPSRITARSRLRVAFRKGDPTNFDQSKINNTLTFLEGAAREKGIEHRILKNIMHVWCERTRRDATLRLWRGDEDKRLYRTAYAHFDTTVKMLNDSLGLCI